jgi:hypothetical protein
MAHRSIIFPRKHPVDKSAGRDELPLVRVLCRRGFLSSYGPDERELVPTGLLELLNSLNS